MDLNTKYLDKLKEEQILADFYTDGYDDSDYGFVVDFNEEFLVIERYSEEFNYEGITIFYRPNVTRIRWSGNELASAAKLIDTSKRQAKKIYIDLTSIHTVLKSVNKIFNHVTAYIQDLNDICIIGQIHEMDEDFVVIHEFGTKSSLDRKFTLFSVSDITRIDAEGQYERNLKKLFGL